jgi:hypothetical protein
MDPTTIVLSPPRNAPATVLRQLAEPWSNLGILPRAVGKLGLDADGDMSFTGKTAECRDWEQLLKRADSDPMQAVHFHSVPAKDDLYLYQWAVQGGRRLSVELGRGKLRYFASDEFEPVGRYQVALMLALAAAADADVCAYGKDYERDLFGTVDSRLLIDKLRDGKLLTQWTPAVFLISTKLIEQTEVEAAIKGNDASHLKYSIATTGYHVLSQYARGGGAR